MFHPPFVIFGGVYSFQEFPASVLKAGNEEVSHLLKKSRFQVLWALSHPRHKGLALMKDPSKDKLEKMKQLLLKKLQLIGKRESDWNPHYQGRLLKKAELELLFHRVYWLKVNIIRNFGVQSSLGRYGLQFHFIPFSQLLGSSKKRKRKAHELRKIVFQVDFGLNMVWKFQKYPKRSDFAEIRTYYFRRLSRYFPLYAPISSVKGVRLYLPIGKREKLKLNKIFDIYIYRQKEKHFEYRGVARIRSVGDNRLHCFENKRDCKRVNPNVPYQSKADIISTNATFDVRKGMLVREVLKKGYELQFTGGFVPHLGKAVEKLSDPQELKLGNQLALSFSLSMNVTQDMSDRFQIHAFYFLYHFQLDTNMYSESASLGLWPAGIVHFGAMKKFYFRRASFLLGLTASIGISGEETQEKDASGDFKLRSDPVLLVGTNLITGVDWFVNHTTSFMFRIGARAQLPLNLSTGSIANYIPLGPWFKLGFSFSL